MRESRCRALAAELDAHGISWSGYRYEFTLVKDGKVVVIVATLSPTPGCAYRIGRQHAGLADIIAIATDRLAGERKD